MSSGSAVRRGQRSLLLRIGLWPLRLLWLLLPIPVGFALGDWFSTLDSGAALMVEAWCWLLWFVALVACMVRSPWSLTVLRVLAPLPLCLVMLAAPSVSGSAYGIQLGGVYAALVAAIAILPMIGDEMINGSAYGAERRMALRPPSFVLFGPMQLVWSVMCMVLVAPIQLAIWQHNRAGLALAVIAVPVMIYGLRTLHQLARRWVVFVPAGFVIHDPMVLVDSILCRRADVDSIGPALSVGGEASVDLSASSSGLLLQVELQRPLAITQRQFGRGSARMTETSSILFGPTMPGEVLREARVRGFRIG